MSASAFPAILSTALGKDCCGWWYALPASWFYKTKLMKSRDICVCSPFAMAAPVPGELLTIEKMRLILLGKCCKTDFMRTDTRWVASPVHDTYCIAAKAVSKPITDVVILAENQPIFSYDTMIFKRMHHIRNIQHNVQHITNRQTCFIFMKISISIWWSLSQNQFM
jgi:hypothetical protein